MAKRTTKKSAPRGGAGRTTPRDDAVAKKGRGETGSQNEAGNEIEAGDEVAAGDEPEEDIDEEEAASMRDDDDADGEGEAGEDDDELAALDAPRGPLPETTASGGTRARRGGGRGKGSAGGGSLSTRDPFQAYMREVQRYPLLSRDEEKELTREFHETQDPAIARRLVTANLRLVIKLAYEYRRAYKNMMDLIQEGNIGLMQAVQRYDPYRGVKLSSYSAWWIRAYMLRFILNNWRLVKLGTTQAQRKLFFNLNKQKAKLTAMGIEPTHKVIADRLGVKEKEVRDMDRRLSSSEASLDAPLGDSEGRSVARIELMPSDQRATDDTVATRQLNELLNEHLAIFRDRLSGKDLTIFDKRMVAEDPLTLQKLGDEFGVSRERVRQLEARLAGKLRDYLKAELGDAVAMGG
ncbi:MAG: RNA polymerase factor sigma-32 [Myxococcota bacterium]